jgi:hypothetical protein
VQFKINDSVVEVPTDLAMITLGQFLAYWNEYGHDLDKRTVAVQNALYEDEYERTLDLLEIEIEEAIAWYSTFTGFDFAIIKEESSNELMTHYWVIKELLRQSESEAYTLAQDIDFNNEVWMIKDWKVTPGSGFTFNELLTSKEASRQIHSLGKGKWEALPYLCAVFLRKKGEAFKDAFVMEGSERLKLFNELPMSIALQVAFFLKISISIAKTTFQSLEEEEMEMLT